MSYGLPNKFLGPEYEPLSDEERQRRCKAHNNRARSYERVRFVGIDGEGYEEDGQAKYVLLAGSEGEPLYNGEGITSREAFDWLLALNNRERLLVGFAINYDINNWLVSLPEDLRQRLGDGKAVYWKTDTAVYRIDWLPGKIFRVSRGKFLTTGLDRKWERECCVTVYDVFGFFQSSFVKAIADNEIGTTSERANVAAMKERRGSFESAEISEVTSYCQLECKLLAAMMTKLRSALDSCSLTLKSWHGAGALANALLKKYEIASHIPATSAEPTDAIMRAYYGGRIQTLQLGIFDEPCYNYDINSAYPAVTAELPSLHGQWSEVNDYQESERWALYQVEWNVPVSTAGIYPFPWRTKTGAIWYPRQGTGFYWAPLVATALAHFSPYVRVRRGWVFRSDHLDSPFSWVPELYEERQRLKAAGDYRQIVLKLGLNSLYGKTAQGVGGRGKHRPPYQSYVWAGLITASTQAKLLDAAMSRPADIIGFATDGIFSRAPLQVSNTHLLGEWSESRVERFAIFQPGVYFYVKNGKLTGKHRGFRRTDVDYDRLCGIWRDMGSCGEITVDCQTFIGLKTALKRKDKTLWRKFIPMKKRLTLRPGHGHSTAWLEMATVIPIGGIERWHPWELDDPTALPAPYIPKGQRLPAEAEAGAAEMTELMEQPDPLL